MKINLSYFGTGRKKRWVLNLQQEFANEYDIKLGNVLSSYFSTPAGAKTFAEWLNEKGFEAKFWCIKPLITYDDDLKKDITRYIGFGVEFSDNCPKLLEVMLKS